MSNMEQETSAKKDIALEESNIPTSLPLSKNPRFLTSAISYIQDNYFHANSEISTDEKQD